MNASESDQYDEAYEAALELLETEMRRYMVKGFQVVYDAEDEVQLARPKKFSFFWFFMVSPFLYLPYYFSKRDETAVIWVDKSNRLRKKGAPAGWLG